jgi:hypothetical protein
MKCLSDEKNIFLQGGLRSKGDQNRYLTGSLSPTSVVDPGSGAFLPPGSRNQILDEFLSGSRIPVYGSRIYLTVTKIKTLLLKA